MSRINTGNTKGLGSSRYTANKGSQPYYALFHAARQNKLIFNHVECSRLGPKPCDHLCWHNAGMRAPCVRPPSLQCVEHQTVTKSAPD